MQIAYNIIMQYCPQALSLYVGTKNPLPDNKKSLHFVAAISGAIRLEMGDKSVYVSESSILATKHPWRITEPTSKFLALYFEPSILHEDLAISSSEVVLADAASMDYWLIEPYLSQDWTIVELSDSAFTYQVQTMRSAAQMIADQGQPFWRCFARTYVFDFLQGLRRLVDNSPIPEHGQRDWLSLVHSFMQGHLAQKLTLSSMAGEFGLNRSKFSEIFKRESGETFHESLIKLRVKKAAWLLRQTELPVSIVGEKIGFNDQTHFARVLKKHLSTTAREYRKLHKLQKAEKS